MAAIDDGVGRKGGKLLQRFVHHGRLALEGPAAAQRKQRVGGEGHFRSRQMVRDMAGGVAGRFDDVDPFIAKADGRIVKIGQEER